MNKIKRVILLNILTICMLFTSVAPVFASITPDTNKANINVNNLEAGVSVNLYKIASVNYDYELDCPQDNAYNWVPEIQSWIDENHSDFSNPENFANQIENMSEEAKEFYDELVSNIKSGAIVLPIDETIISSGEKEYPVTNENIISSISFENKEMGTYLVLIENGYRVYTASVINLVPRFDESDSTWKLSQEEVVIKSSTPTITQTITDDIKTKDNYSTIQEFDVSIVSDIPTYLENSLSKKYTISGQLDESISLNPISVKVYGLNGNTTEEITTGWTKTVGNNTFEIDFNYDSIKNFEKVKIEYKAELSKDDSLKLDEIGNQIEAKLDYSNNPYVENSIETMQATNITVFTYGIEINKIDKSNNHKLVGAEFVLKNNNALLYFVKEAEGVYYLAKETDENATTTLKTNSNGSIIIKGLDEGNYSIKETHAPDGYNISSVEYSVNLSDEDINGKLDGDNDGIFSISIPNTKAFFIPITGGNGIYLFAICGSISAIIGIALFMVISKNTKKQ